MVTLSLSISFFSCTIFRPFNNEYVQCKLAHRPSVSMLQLHLLCLFGAGIVMSTWCWTPSSLETWKRYLRKKCGKDVSEEVKMPKHKVIAQTWAKRKEFEDKGRLSITLCNTHTDPVGLNFDVNDLNSSETNDISSTWANYLPQFVKRRMALTGAVTGAGAGGNSASHATAAHRKNSLDSEISFSVRHVSVESRRNSVDSQVSVKIQEMKTKVARSRGGRHHSKHHSTGKRYQKARDFSTTHGRRHNGRRESSTSIESQIIALQKTTYPNNRHKVGLFAQSTKNHTSASKGRSGHGTLDPADITEFLARNGQLILPFLQNQGMTTSSDEEENSKGSLKIQGSRLDVVLKQDLSDDGSEDSDRHDGPQIEEIHDHDDIGGKSKRQSAYEELLKQTQKSHDSNHNHKQSRNSTRNSRHSRKSQPLNTSQHKRSLKRNQNSHSNTMNRRKSTNSKIFEMDFLNTSDLNLQLKRELTFGHHDDDSASDDSFSSVDLPLNVFMQNSYSGHSKTSCDVGIQADAFDISQRTSADEEDDLKKCVRKLNNQNNQRRSRFEEDALEMQTLMAKHKDTPLIMTESEKLKMLLLPSK